MWLHKYVELWTVHFDTLTLNLRRVNHFSRHRQLLDRLSASRQSTLQLEDENGPVPTPQKG